MTGDTTVRVIRKGKMFTFVESSGTSRLALHIVKVFFASPLSKMWKFPVFMIAEPVILLLITIAFIVWVAKCLKKNN